MPTEKVIWVVNYNAVTPLLNKASEVGATAVAIRSDNNVSKAIKLAHEKNIKVYSWRWPSALRDPAMKEADKIVDLFDKGLDGYFVDPEGAEGKPYDWAQKGLQKLAEEFCKRVTGAAAGRPFGVTSHYLAAAVYPKLPWETFFSYASVLLPQAYWRSTKGIIGHGIPEDNYSVSISSWVKAGGSRDKIVPMAGELSVSKPEEIKEYVAAASRKGISSLHFYTYENGISVPVWEAVKRA